jgi:outer membrane biosynthesis protein TonB
MPSASPAASDSVVTNLDRAALGPVNTEHYLKAFARLDAMGRTLTSWHWPACFFTLGWMVYRQLWGAALVYVAAAEGVALLVFGLGRPLLQWPQAVEWGVVGAFAVLGSVVPGLYAHAILHADIRKRVTKALAASANIPEALDKLTKQAVSRKRLTWVIAGHALLSGAALLAYVGLPQGTASGDGSGPAASSGAATGAPASANWNTPSPTLVPASAAASSPAITPAASAPMPSAEAAAEDALPRTDQASAPTNPKATAPQAAAQAPSKPEKKPEPLPEKAPPAKAAPKPADKAKEAPTAKAQATKASESASAKPAAAAKKPAASAAQRPAQASSPAASEATVGTAPGFYINVGLFAEEGNARKAQSRLLNEGLPAFRQTLDSAKGTRIRVRVGPFTSRTEAQAAAASIRALELDAVIFEK